MVSLEEFAGEDRRARFGLPPYTWLLVQLIVLFTLLPALYLLELRYLQEPLLRANLWSQGMDRFGDFWHYRVLFNQLHRTAFFAANDRFAYPAPCALLYEALYHLGRYPHAGFALLLWAIEGFSAVLFCRALLQSGMQRQKAVGLVVLLTLTSYPWHFLYDRGNIEVFVYVFVAGGLWAWFEGHDALAAVLWGVAASLKIYPVILLAMYMRRGRWRMFWLGLLSASATLLFSFWYVGPSIRVAAMGTVAGVLGFVGHYGGHARSVELVFDHSILGALKEVFEIPKLARTNSIGWLSRLYQLCIVLVAPWMFWRWRRTAPALNQLCLLLLAIMLAPPVSYDYTLIYVYLVLGVVLCCAIGASRRSESFPGAMSYMVAFAVACTAEDWINMQHLQPNGALKCVALLVLAVNVIRFPLRLHGDTQASVPV